MKKTLLIVVFVIAGVLGKGIVQEVFKSKGASVFSGESRSFNVDGNNYSYRSDGDGVLIKFNDASYNIPRSELKQTVDKVKQSVDEKKFNQYARNPEMANLLKSATGAYGFIISSEEAFVNWCTPYYKLSKYPNKLQNHFKNKKQKAETIIHDAWGDNWKDAFNEVIAKISNVTKQQIDNEYLQTKQLAMQNGENVSKGDFCKAFDENADQVISFKSRLFGQMYPNF